MGEKGQGTQVTSYLHQLRTPSLSSRTLESGRRSPAPKSPSIYRGQMSTGSDERCWHHTTQKSSEKKGQGGPGQGGPPTGGGARAVLRVLINLSESPARGRVFGTTVQTTISCARIAH